MFNGFINGDECFICNKPYKIFYNIDGDVSRKECRNITNYGYPHVFLTSWVEEIYIGTYVLSFSEKKLTIYINNADEVRAMAVYHNDILYQDVDTESKIEQYISDFQIMK